MTQAEEILKIPKQGRLVENVWKLLNGDYELSSMRNIETHNLHVNEQPIFGFF